MRKTLHRIAFLMMAWTVVIALGQTARVNAESLTVSASAVVAGGLYNYNYTLKVIGGSSSSTFINNLFLGSDDLSPLNLVITKNNAAAPSWLWLGNNSPSNYLQFFSLSDHLSNNDELQVRFTSAFVPANSHFVIGLNGQTSRSTPVVNNVLAPTAVPEPATMTLFGAGLAAFGTLTRRRSRNQNRK